MVHNCDMNFLNRHYLLHKSTCLILFALLQFTKSQLQSPCPNIFEYRFDNNNNLYGYILVPTPEDHNNVIRLDVELSVGNRVQNSNGRLELGTSRETIIQNILNNLPLQYNLYFPEWFNTPPKITQIAVNGQSVCSGSPFSRWRVSVLTTVNLQHTLRLSIPLSAGGSNDIPFDFRPQSTIRPSRPRPQTTISPFRPQPTRPFRPQIIPDDTPGSAWIPDNFPDFEIETTRQPPRVNRPSSKTDLCGLIANTNSLIVNGKDISRGSHPWLAALFVQGNEDFKYTCSTTLVTRRHVITAGHCVQIPRKRYRPDEIWVVLGRENIKRWSNDGAQIIEAENIIIHPDFKFTTADADLAVVVLSENVIFSTLVRPACIWSSSGDLRLLVQKRGIVIGWGKDEKGQRVTSKPRQTSMPVVSTDECIRANTAFADITSDRTFCAGDRNNSGPCNGDSGGGFFIEVNGRWTLRGVTSLAIEATDGTCDLSQFVVFVDIAQHLQWLSNILSN